MKLPNISDVDQWDQPGKSGEAGAGEKREPKKKKAKDRPASRAWLSRSSSKI